MSITTDKQALERLADTWMDPKSERGAKVAASNRIARLPKGQQRFLKQVLESRDAPTLPRCLRGAETNGNGVVKSKDLLSSLEPSAEETQEQEKELRVYWDDDEWRTLTAFCCKHRLKEPSTALTALVDRCQAQWPESRRRTATSVLGPLTGKMAEYYKNMAEELGEVDRLRRRNAELESMPSREEVLDSLLPGDAVARFGNLVLEHMPPTRIVQHLTTENLLGAIPFPTVAGYFVSQALTKIEDTGFGLADLTTALTRVLANSPGETVRRQQARSHQAAKPLRVIIAGTIGDSTRRLEQEFGDRAKFRFYTCDQVAQITPQQADVVICWVNTVTHKLEGKLKSCIPVESRYIRYSGGYSGLEKKVRTEIERATL